jgi:hypothetical protein
VSTPAVKTCGTAVGVNTEGETEKPPATTAGTDIPTWNESAAGFSNPDVALTAVLDSPTLLGVIMRVGVTDATASRTAMAISRYGVEHLIRYRVIRLTIFRRLRMSVTRTHW